VSAVTMVGELGYVPGAVFRDASAKAPPGVPATQSLAISSTQVFSRFYAAPT